MLKVRSFKDREEAAKNLAEDLGEYISSLGDTHILLLLSGGSALSILEHFPGAVLGENITIGVLDERFDPDPTDQNYYSLKQFPFYKKAKESGVNFIESNHLTTVYMLADDLTRDWESWVKNNPDGKIVATMGIGPDGHTAGIMPFPEDPQKFKELFEDDISTIAYSAGSKNPIPIRATATNTFLRKIDRAFVFMSGKDKTRAAISLAGVGSLHELPARIIKEIPHTTYATNELSPYLNQ